ncbi:hypothetical protein [Candidatus Regiella endosymbiont of Tuberolachnus salignus]|uniref:hypothetical protein n=1 Tax=Candidatus Regiella endosymbiont of Tuberolachnus salignus TaxID=3077956 RepID=UPI0030D39CF4
MMFLLETAMKFIDTVTNFIANKNSGAVAKHTSLPLVVRINKARSGGRSYKLYFKNSNKSYLLKDGILQENSEQTAVGEALRSPTTLPPHAQGKLRTLDLIRYQQSSAFVALEKGGIDKSSCTYLIDNGIYESCEANMVNILAPSGKSLLVGNDNANWLDGGAGTERKSIIGHDGDDVLALHIGSAAGGKGKDTYMIKSLASYQRNNVSERPADIEIDESDNEISIIKFDYEYQNVKFYDGIISFKTIPPTRFLLTGPLYFQYFPIIERGKEKPLDEMLGKSIETDRPDTTEREKTMWALYYEHIMTDNASLYFTIDLNNGSEHDGNTAVNVSTEQQIEVGRRAELGAIIALSAALTPQNERSSSRSLEHSPLQFQLPVVTATSTLALAH